MTATGHGASPCRAAPSDVSVPSAAPLPPRSLTPSLDAAHRSQQHKEKGDQGADCHDVDDGHWINGDPTPIAHPMSGYPLYAARRKDWGINGAQPSAAGAAGAPGAAGLASWQALLLRATVVCAATKRCSALKPPVAE